MDMPLSQHVHASRSSEVYVDIFVVGDFEIEAFRKIRNHKKAMKSWNARFGTPCSENPKSVTVYSILRFLIVSLYADIVHSMSTAYPHTGHIPGVRNMPLAWKLRPIQFSKSNEISLCDDISFSCPYASCLIVPRHRSHAIHMREYTLRVLGR